MQSCGIKAKLEPYYSIGLGAAQIPMLQMLQGYTMFPNRGLSTEPILLTRIEDKNGNILEEFTSNTKQVISEADAYTMEKLMQGVIQFGTARNLNAYKIPVQKAGKTGTTNSNADGWFIGYTPELIAGTWVGCEDPFISIYSGTAGGADMSAPKWGIFMSKVYADKKLGYGVIKEFAKPASMENDLISADADWGQLFKQGDSTTVDQGNGDANDFINDPVPENNTPIEKIGIESDIPNAKADTNSKAKGKLSSSPPPPPPANKPADDKNKKPVAKPKPNNDY